MNEIVLELKDIVKDFPGVRALNGINFELRKGEVHALVGENGSGKSTLMNIIAGVHQPNHGEIYLHGQHIHFKDAKDAQDRGISMIHQELSLAPTLSVMENIFIGRQLKNKIGLIDYKRMQKVCTELLREFENKNIKHSDLVKNLSLSNMQLIEIIKAIHLKNKIIVMDEPTSSLTKVEVINLFEHIKRLKNNGYSIVFISHRIEEVKQIADRVTVLRDGNHIVTKNSKDMNINEIIMHMVGRVFEHNAKRTNCSKGNKVLEVNNLSNKYIHEISFDLKEGEVLGVTGLVGSGRTELINTLFGAEGYDSGEIYLYGEKTVIRSENDAIRRGIGLIPEGRITQGIFSVLNVLENIAMVKRKDFTKLGVLNYGKIFEATTKMKDRLKIKTPTMKNQIKFLSGGNQQKAIIGRWLINSPRILFLDEPTHGIDVGAKAEIYKIIDELAKQGVSVVLISSELPEILTLSDRVVVMGEGRINGLLENVDLTQEEIMSLATKQMTTV